MRSGHRQSPFVHLLVILTAALLILPRSSASPAAAGIADGGGIWVNIWHYPDGDLEAYCRNLKAHGVRNLFIQTSRSNTPAIVHPDKLGAIIDGCKKHGIRVIAWSFAELVEPVADAEKMVAVALFTSPQGHRIDGIAPNLEKNLEQWRVESYSKHIRSKLGGRYPMMAVVYSPLNRAPEVARTPWTTLAKHFDIIAPMAYWNSKYQKLDPYEYTVTTIQKVRELTGRPDIEIHVVGDGMGTDREAIHAFLRACQRAEATSASLYPNHIVTPEQYQAISRYSDYFPANARFRLAAFREMIGSGSLSRPPQHDPSRPISRGEFYNLVCKQLLLRTPRHTPALTAAEHAGGQMSHAEAHKFLLNRGLLPQTVKSAGEPEHLTMPMPTHDAVGLLARAIDNQQAPAQPGTLDRLIQSSQQQLGGMLSQPVHADPVTRPSPPGKPLNYLDAALLVLQARSAI